MSGYIALFAGSSLADHTGTDGRTTGLGLISMLSDLFGIVYPSVAIGIATTNNLDPGSGWPAACATCDINGDSAGVDIVVTGVLAGYRGQRVRFRNSGAVKNVVLPIANAGSLAANRWLGAGGSLTLVPGQSKDGVYYTSPTPGWSI